MRRRFFVIAAFGVLCGVFAARFVARDESSTTSAAVEAPTSSTSGASLRAPITAKPTPLPPSGGVPAVSRPVLPLAPDPEPHADWSDPRRDERWAPGAELVIRDLAEGRLAIDHPDTVITATRCVSRTCHLTLEVPADQADLVFAYLSLLFTIDGMFMKTSREPAAEEGRETLHLRLLLPEATMDPSEIARRQRQADIDYPEILANYRRNVARLRAEGLSP